MKKHITVASLAILALVVIVGCGGNKATETTQAAALTPMVAAPETVRVEADRPQWVVHDGFNVGKVRYASGTGWMSVWGDSSLALWGNNEMHGGG